MLTGATAVATLATFLGICVAVKKAIGILSIRTNARSAVACLSGPEPSPATHQQQPTDSRLGVCPHISRCTPLER